MKQLSGLDASFLHLETPEMPMHVGALHLFELPAGSRGKFVVALRRHIASRLPAAPVLRRRLWWMPLNLANPAWVDAEPDLRQHIVEVRLPKGADVAALEVQVGALHPVLLDRKRPLWKMHVFEGLAPAADGRRRVALYTQVHHAAVDGQAAVALANLLFDTTPEPRAIELRPSTRSKVFKLDMAEMLRGVIGGQAQKVATLIRTLPSTAGALSGAAAKVLRPGDSAGGAGKRANKLGIAPRTPLNVSVSSERAFAGVSLPWAEAKALGRAHGATLNDIVLLVCATALRRYFAKRRQLPKKPLVAAVPVSLREAGDTSADNQASLALVNLGTHIADTGERLAHIRAATASMKATLGSVKSVLPTDFPSLGMPWLMEAAAALYGRAKLADRVPQLANVAISNVPGPPLPLYLAGARMLSNWPTSIVVHGMALNVTVQSYDRTLDFGLMADARAMPDVRELADGIAIAFDDLRALPLPEGAAAAGSAGNGMRRAGRRLAQAAGSAVGNAVGAAARQAVGAAVAQATRARERSPAKRRSAG